MDELAPIMSFELEETSDGALLRIAGELDMSCVERLDAAMAPLMDSGLQRLVIDVGELTFADSSAIALWVRWANAPGEVSLREPSPLLRRVIASMGLDKRLNGTP